MGNHDNLLKKGRLADTSIIVTELLFKKVALKRKSCSHKHVTIGVRKRYVFLLQHLQVGSSETELGHSDSIQLMKSGSLPHDGSGICLY